MTMVIIGKADRNRLVGEVIDETPRTGARYLDLATGDLIALVKKTGKESASEEEKPETEKGKKKAKKK